MKRDNRVVLGIMFAVIVLVVVGLGSLEHKEKKEEFSQEYILAEELPPLLSFTYYDKKQWEEKLLELADGKLDYGELEDLLHYMGAQEYVSYEKKAGFRKVPRKVFFQVYEQLVDILDVDNRVSLSERVFIGEEAKQEQWLTQCGYETIAMPIQYLRQFDMYRVYQMGDTILGLKEKLHTSIKWEDVFVHKIKDGRAEILFEKEEIQLELPKIPEQIDDTICDIEWQDGQVTAIYKKEDKISGTVLSYNDRQIEIAGYGALKHNGNLKIYKTYGTLEQLDESKLVIGNLMAEFVVAKGEVCGIILKEPAQMGRIRVLLLNGEEPYRSEVYIKATEDMTVTRGEYSETISAGTVLKASEYGEEGQEGHLLLKTATEEGQLFLTDAAGKELSLGYEGTFEIRKYKQGYCVVNELPLEDYLCAVVPSEMPASYELEALRAQAVCARSYACIQLSKGQYAGFAANVDDSTNYQVYNKQPRNEKTTRAVQDTVGEVLKYQDVIAEAYYYSTSCGFSQNVDVWNMPKEGENEYLKSVSLLTGETEIDISNEEAFGAFIQKKEYEAYDSDAAYFRWRAEVNVKEHLEAFCQAIEERAAANSGNVQIFDKKGKPSMQTVRKLGAVEKLIPEERSQGGVLTKLRICFEKGSILLTTEYNIRKVLGAAVTVMTDKDDKAITVLNLLPSAAFTIIPVEQGYVLYGGGYGHGIGLSQNGANGMAKAGGTYVDILHKFYQNIQIENIYNSTEGK